MAGIRFGMDGFVGEDPNGTYIALFDMKLPNALAAKLPEIRNNLLALKVFFSKLNEGQANEENTVKLVWQKCYHDENPPRGCDPEVEI